MKTWTEAEIRELEINETAFGPNDPNSVDAEKFAVTDDNGNILGYKEQYGQSKAN